MDLPLPATIRLTGLRLMLSIGWGDDERRTPQSIRFDLEIGLPAVPAAARTDRLEDTVDYFRLSETVRTAAHAHPVRLIERLAGVVAAALVAELPRGAELRLRVTKERAPIRDLEGGASIEILVTVAGTP